MRSKYYGLSPALGKRIRRPKNIAFVYIRTDSDGVFQQAAAYDEEAWLLEDPYELADYLGSLPASTWIITYGMENWKSALLALLRRFSHITGIGDESRVLELEDGDYKISIVDTFQFTVCGLPEALQKYTGKEINRRVHPVVMAFSIKAVWDKLAEVCAHFKCYPSKTPGATAIKVWRRFLATYIKPPGLQINRLARSALGPPALHWQPGVYDQAFMYDINASYPSVMSIIRYPVRSQVFTGSAPETTRWIARVRINYVCRSKFSPLAVELVDGSHVCPTKVSGSVVDLTYIDALALEITGEFEITEWIEGIYWKPEDELDVFGDWFKAIEDASQNPQDKQALKIISRSLHSKFSQKPYYTQVEFVKPDPENHKQLVQQGKLLDIIELPEGEEALKIGTRKRTGFRPFDIPAWEALTMAAARYKIYASIDENTIYVHTDAIISTTVRDDLPVGSAFGQWKQKACGETYIAGIGLYVIGEELGQSGMKTTRARAYDAIQKAARGISSTVEIFYDTNMFSPVETGKGKFTVSCQVYPKASLKGNKAWVTRSPTRQIRRKFRSAVLFTQGGEIWL